MSSVALITGAARRIGRALALHLARQGWHIAAHYHHSADEAGSLASEVQALGGQCITLQADLENMAEVESLLPRASSALGAVTLLVNNAAVFERDSLATFSPAAWQRHHTINHLVPLVLIQGMARALPDGQSGNVVNLLDGNWGWSLSGDFFSYTSSKLGLRSMSEYLASLLAPRIRINGIALGLTIPGHQEKTDTFSRVASSAPLQRLNTVDDVLAAFDYFLAATSVTGEVIEIGSGLHLRWSHHSY